MRKTILYAAAVAIAAVAVIVIVGCHNGSGDVSDNLNRFLDSFGYTLTTTANPPEGGEVRRNLDKETYTLGERVTVWAVPYGHYTFIGWSGASESSEDNLTLDMYGDKYLTANFRRNTYTLMTTANPPEGGEVRRYPDKETYNPNEQVTLRVITYEEHYKFNGWSGASESTDGEVSIIMDSDKWVTANFTRNNYTVIVSGGTGGGSYTVGATVSITAAASSGYVFKNWTTTSAGVTLANANSATTTFTMPPNAVTVTANFTQISFTDSRDGRTYKIVTIGGKRWMAENLNYAAGGSWCYNYNNTNCNTYGRLYDWSTARTACPSGWHLPSYSEWDALATAVGGQAVAGRKLKSTYDWHNYGNGTDEFGFSALPGGFYDGRAFGYLGYFGDWWTATEYYNSYAYYRNMGYDSNGLNGGTDDKSLGFSVRCVAD